MKKQGLLKKLFFGMTIGLNSLVLNSCNEIPEKMGPKDIISVEPYHATRIKIIYLDRNGNIYTKTLHHLNEFESEEGIIDPQDYLVFYGGKMDYGKFDSTKYAEYKKRKKELP